VSGTARSANKTCCPEPVLSDSKEMEGGTTAVW